MSLPDDVTPADIGVIWKDLTPSDFPEAWRDMEDESGMGLPTLVEVMSEDLEPHERERILRAMAESAETTTVEVLLTNYKGESPTKRVVKSVTSVRIVTDEAEEEDKDEGLLTLMEDRDAARYPLLVLNKTDGRAAFRMDEVVGWEETHE